MKPNAATYFAGGSVNIGVTDKNIDTPKNIKFCQVIEVNWKKPSQKNVNNNPMSNKALSTELYRALEGLVVFFWEPINISQLHHKISKLEMMRTQSVGAHRPCIWK